MWQYMNESWEASRIRVRFEERFLQAVELGEQALKERQRWEEVPKGKRSGPEPPVLENVFVIGHSMGSAVAYEALTGRRMTDLFEQKFKDGKVGMHFISVGSALNRAWDLIPKGERFRFHRQISPHVNWLNLWSGPDPVPRGPLDGPQVKKDSEWNRDRWKDANQKCADSDGMVVNQRIADADEMVVNQSDIFSDHSAYWNNAEEVMAPILDRLTNGAFKTKLTLKKISRRGRVSVLAIFKAAALLVGCAAAVLSATTGFDSWLIDLVLKDSLGLNPDWLKKEYLSPLVVSVAFGISAAVGYSTLVKWLWDFWDRAVKYT